MRPSATTRGVRAASAPSIDAVGGDDPGEVQLGDHLDDARAADAGDAGVAPWPRRIPARPTTGSQPITLNRGSSVSRSIRTRSIAPGAARWPQAICAPSNAGPVGLRAGEQPLAVAEHDLGVGADVDEQRDLVGEVRAPRPASRRPRPRRRGRRCTAGRRPARRDGRADAELARPARVDRARRWPARTAPSRAPSGRCRAAGDA